MTSPRSKLVDPTTPGYYHCVSRCVRRAWHCGVDDYSGKCYEHRRPWIEDRLVELGAVFALGVYAYAVMSNHLHVVARLDPALAWSWSAEKVARRWTAVFPVRVAGELDEQDDPATSRHHDELLDSTVDLLKQPGMRGVIAADRPDIHRCRRWRVARRVRQSMSSSRSTQRPSRRSSRAVRTSPSTIFA